MFAFAVNTWRSIVFFQKGIPKKDEVFFREKEKQADRPSRQRCLSAGKAALLRRGDGSFIVIQFFRKSSEMVKFSGKNGATYIGGGFFP